MTRMGLKYLSKVEQDKLTHKIIGCAMEVHNTLGNGFQEVIYQRCLSIELNNSGIEHQREVEMPIFYKGRKWVCVELIFWYWAKLWLS